MEHAIPVALPEEHPDLIVNTEAQVNIHASSWDAFRDTLGWLLALNKGEPQVRTSGAAVWVIVRSAGIMYTLDYILFAPHLSPGLGLSRVEYVELALSDALLRP